MSGHSKWSTIKHKKAALDAKRGKVFTKLIKEITVAARMGGGDPNSNPRLRTAMAAAKGANMPLTNVERAIKKGTGELPGVTYEETTFEGYGPSGVAVLVEILTDNKNRITGEVRHIFSKYNGNLGQLGCVSRLFQKKGFFSLSGVSEDQVMEVALEAGADDILQEDDAITVTCPPDSFEDVKSALTGAGFEIDVAEITKIPSTTVKLEGKDAVNMLKLMEHMEENDDVQNVYANFDIDDEVMSQMG